MSRRAFEAPRPTEWPTAWPPPQSDRMAAGVVPEHWYSGPSCSVILCGRGKLLGQITRHHHAQDIFTLVNVLDKSDLVQALDLSSRLKDEMPVIQPAADDGLIDGDIQDSQQGHAGARRSEDPMDSKHSLVGDHEPIAVLLENAP